MASTSAKTSSRRWPSASARLRKKDFGGRFSCNKFGVILTTCTTDELSVAAERLLAGVHDETIATAAGPLAMTVTIGGVNAPRHAHTVPEILSRAQGALQAARQAARFFCRLSAQRGARRHAPRKRVRN